MTNLNSSIITSAAIVETLNNLIENNVPAFCLSDDGEQVSGHWSGTKEAMEEFLGRYLTDDEVTCLSLTRCFGPTPTITDDEALAIIGQVWPNGNNNGNDWMSWEELLNTIASGWVITMDTSGFTDSIEITINNTVERIKEDLNEANQHSYTKKSIEEIFFGTLEEAKSRAQDIEYANSSDGMEDEWSAWEKEVGALEGETPRELLRRKFKGGMRLALNKIPSPPGKSDQEWDVEINEVRGAMIKHS
jgi:hypothetical protein